MRSIGMWAGAAVLSLVTTGYTGAAGLTDASRVKTEGDTGSKTQMVVTVQQPQNQAHGSVGREDVLVKENGKRALVTDWRRLSEKDGAVQLVIVMDDSSRSSVSLQLEDLKKFVTSLPPAVSVGVGYMRNGSVYMAQELTGDHALAAKSLRMPQGVLGGNGSPYFSVSDFVKHWPSQTPAVREILMVTDGVDRYYSNGRFDPDNPYVHAAIKDAQTAGVIVHSIYFASTGGLDRNSGIAFAGQSYLLQLSEATGGKAYYIGDGNPVSFQPFLDEIKQQLGEQYLLTFVAKGEGLQRVKVTTEIPHTKLTGQESVVAGQKME